MKCNKCGYEYNGDYAFCPNCGESIRATEQEPPKQENTAQPISLNPAADKVLAALKDNLFLALCILISVKCLFSFSENGLPVFDILYTIFLWLVFADSRKGFANERHLRRVSGTVYASYVVVNVASIILIVSSLITVVALAVASSTQMIQDFISQIFDEIGEEVAFSQMPGEVTPFFVLVFMLVLIVALVAILVINLVGISKIHKFAKSIYMGIIFQNPNFENPIAVKNWLMFFGVCSAISVVTSLGAGFEMVISSGCGAAATIIASVLVNKHFVDRQYYDYGNLN